MQLMVIALELVFVIGFRKMLFSSLDTSGIWEWIIFSIFMLFALPALTLKVAFNEKLKPFNFRFNPESFKYVLLIGLVIVAGLAIIVLKLNWHKPFPVSVWVLGPKSLAIFIDMMLLPLAILAQEFFFRGWMQTILKREFNDKVAVVIQALLATLYVSLFIGSISWPKTGFFLILNLVLGLIAQHFRSIYASALINWLIIFSLDSFAIYKLSQLQQLVK